MAEPLPLVEGDQPIPYPDPFAPVDPLVIQDEQGTVIFALHDDGTATMPDPEKAAQAAAIFWREVMAMADRLGVTVSFTS